MPNKPAIVSVMFALLGAARAQVADRAGFARFPDAIEDHALFEAMRRDRRSATTLVYQGGRRIGIGQVTPWLRGRNHWTGEFRGFVGKGRLRLGPLRLEPLRLEPGAAVPVRPRFAIEGQELRWQQADGLRFPRWRIAADLDCSELDGSKLDGSKLDGSKLDGSKLDGSKLGGLKLEADLYGLGHGRFEVRLWFETAAGFDPTRAVSLHLMLPGSRCRVVVSAGVSVVFDRGSARLHVPAGVLRAGDSAYVVLTSERQSVFVRPAAAVLAGVDVRRTSRTRDRSLFRRQTESIRRLLANRPTAGVDVGDFVRRDKPEVLWTHNEFDLTLGFMLRALDTGDRRLVAAAFDGAVHTLGRDLAPASSHRHAGLRLPVRHGPVHGRGPVDLGHVFLEGCLLTAWATADRLLFERASRVVDDLAEFADRSPGFRRLRDVAWPITNLEFATLLLHRAPWETSANGLLGKLATTWNERLRCLEFRESVRGAGRRVQGLWLVSGLLLPALERACARGQPDAKAVRDKLVAAFEDLPRIGGKLATHYWWTPERRWQPSQSKSDPCCEAWVVEGLRRVPGLRRFADRQAKALTSRLPGDGWDPATRLALCLRLGWLR